MKNKEKKFRGFYKKKIRGFSKFSKIEFWWRQIFKNLIIHKPSLGSREIPQKIWARSVQSFWRLLDTNKQTNKQTDRQAKFIYRLGFQGASRPSTISTMGSRKVPQKIWARSVQPFWRLLETDGQTEKQSIEIDCLLYLPTITLVHF